MLNPHTKKYLDWVASFGKPPMETQTVEQARAGYRAMRSFIVPEVPDCADIANRMIPGPNGGIPLRIYRPMGSKPDDRLPAFVYIHGGGWTIGDLDTHDVLCRQLANKSNAVVVSVDYRLAPENVFPCAVDECFATVQWVADQADALHVDRDRIAVGGDSAGGNLAAVIALMAREKGGPKIIYQVLIYPVTEMTADRPSHFRNAEGYALTRKMMLWFRDHYVKPENYGDWRCSPLLAKDLSGLPPALVITAEYDPLVDEGDAYAKRLQDAGVPVLHERYAGQIHGFLPLGKMIPDANRAVDQIAAEMRKAFAK